MSFIRTLAALAAGFAAAKGHQKFKKMGGMAGLQDAMKDNPTLAGMQAQMGEMMEKFGMPGGADGLQNMMDRWAGGGQAGGVNAMAGLSGVVSALGGAGAAGAEQMMDALTGNKAVSTAIEDNAKLMIRAMIQAARADGEIDDEERAKLMDHLGEIDAEERAFIEAELEAPVDPVRLAADTGDQAKAQVYAMAVSAVRVDTAGEAAYLDSLASALGLSDETRARVHQAMGA